MIELADVGTWASGALIVVGIIQWIKGFAGKDAVASKVWALLTVLVSIGAATALAIKGGGAWSSLAWDSAGIFAFSQLGYEMIIQNMSKMKIGGGYGGSAQAPFVEGD